MENDKIIRQNPLFELYVDDNSLIVNNTNYFKDNCVINLKDISKIEIIRNTSFFSKVIELYFGFFLEAKSNMLRISINGKIKNIVLNNCNIEKAEIIVYNVKQFITHKNEKQF